MNRTDTTAAWFTLMYVIQPRRVISSPTKPTTVHVNGHDIPCAEWEETKRAFAEQAALKKARRKARVG